MPSRKFAPLAGLAQGLPGDPVFIEAPQPLEPDTISVTSDYASATGPVNGYRATRSSCATKTDSAIRDIPQSISMIPASVLKGPAASLYGRGDPGEPRNFTVSQTLNL